MKTLIVDDEVLSRRILTHMMKPLGAVVTAGDGKRAIELYREAMDAREPFDLLTLDVSMPGMDGLQVLRLIRTLEKSRDLSITRTTKIVMMSSRMNKSIIRECIGLGCNDYIAKPVNETRLLKKLRKLGFKLPETEKKVPTTIHPKVMGKIIEKFYKGSIEMPVLPPIVKEIQAVLDLENSAIDDLVPVVEKDPVVSGKLVRIANSPLYRGLDAITDLRAAVVRLGLEATRTAVSTVATRQLFDSENASLKQILQKHWVHSFAAACCGKLIAEKIPLQNSDAIFLMGTTYDLGNVLLMKAIADLSPDISFEDPALIKAIHEIHTTFGAALLKKWKFPDIFIRLAELHHWNEFPPGVEKEIQVIHLADFLAGSIGYGFPGFEITSSDEEADPAVEKGIAAILEMLALEPDLLTRMADEAEKTIKGSIQAF